MKKKILLTFVMIFLLLATPSYCTTFLGPSSYLSFSDSPFQSFTFDFFHLEDFEDNLLDAPGVTAINGATRNPSSFTDSVDGDDGLIDGSGNAGHSFHEPTEGLSGITFSFDSGILASLPTHVGIVLTDISAGTIPSFEAFDALGNSLGSFAITSADSIFTSEQGVTSEDRFLGVIDEGGISKINISLNSGVSGIEVDHLQYGASTTIPEGSSFLMLAIALGLSLLLPRK